MGDIIGSIFYFVFMMTIIAAWFTHIFFCFAAGLWGFLVAGAIMFPIAIVHGFWVWFQ